MQKWPVVKEKDVKLSQEFKSPFCRMWMMKAKSLKQLLVIKEICSWLPPGLDVRKVPSQEHFSLTANRFFNDFDFTIFLNIQGHSLHALSGLSMAMVAVSDLSSSISDYGIRRGRQ